MGGSLLSYIDTFQSDSLKQASRRGAGFKCLIFDSMGFMMALGVFDLSWGYHVSSSPPLSGVMVLWSGFHFEVIFPCKQVRTTLAPG